MTTPVVESTVAMDVLRLLQVPPAVESVKVVVSPTQAFAGPVMIAGSGFTVIGRKAPAPQPLEYDITVGPGATGVTKPVKEPTVALDVLLLLQKPDVADSVYVAG